MYNVYIYFLVVVGIPLIYKQVEQKKILTRFSLCYFCLASKSIILIISKEMNRTYIS